MNIISKIIVGIMAVALMSSCVDDFQDANPPRAFDSPYFVLNVNQTAILSDQTTELTLSVVDAPGKIEAVEFSLGDDAGTERALHAHHATHGGSVL